MVTLHVGGKAVSWADAEKLFADAPPAEPIEARDAGGRLIAVIRPAVEPDGVVAADSDKPDRR